MAKMFYSLDEAAAKLGKTAAEVREMASRGQLQEFRDRERLMFKREQVDLLAGGGEDDGVIPLADSGELDPPQSPASSGSSIGVSPKEQTGISIFDADATDESDPSAVTRVTNAPASLVDPGEKSGTGGMLDLSKEADDTSLGGGLLEDVYGSDTIAQQTAAEPAIGDAGGALFETPGMEAAEPAAAPMMIAAEPYDGAGSGLVGGLALAMIAAVGIAAFTLLTGLTTTAGGGLLAAIGGSFMILVGVMVGLIILCGGIGWFLGKRS